LVEKLVKGQYYSHKSDWTLLILKLRCLSIVHLKVWQIGNVIVLSFIRKLQGKLEKVLTKDA